MQVTDSNCCESVTCRTTISQEPESSPEYPQPDESQPVSPRAVLFAAVSGFQMQLVTLVELPKFTVRPRYHRQRFGGCVILNPGALRIGGLLLLCPQRNSRRDAT